MHLFAAVRLQPVATVALQAALDGLPHPQPRWIPAPRWHLTLAFYGEVDDSIGARIATRLDRAARRSRPMTLRLSGAGHFGHTVLWVGVAGDVEPLGRLADACAAAGRREGIGTDGRRFRPHLTLARVRGSGDLRPWAERLRSYEGPVWTATRSTLIRSTLGPSPSYDDIASWPLGART